MRHLRPRKRLGQSFLTYEPVADELVAALGPGPDDTVLEIGPGKGILTRRLLARAGRVIAVELDERLVMGLRTELGGDAKLELAHADFMEYDLGGLSDVLVLGNLPYCVSSQMLFRLFDWVQAWRRAVLTTQREFAARVLAEPGTKGYGALTVFFERLATRERLFNVPARRFKPVPDVVSTAFRLVRRERPLYPVADEQVFRRVVKACFCQRRKTLANNLVAGLGISKPAAVELARAAGVSPDCRAETLTGEMFAGLAETAGGEVRTMNSERRTP